MNQENMNCKNCQTVLSDETKFCPACGGKVVTERITFKTLMKDIITNVFGWDNKYFTTLRAVITRPHIIFQEYIDGTRKKYMNPFGFFAVGAAIALLVFNQFGDKFIEMTTEINQGQIELIGKAMHENIEDIQKEKHLKAGETVTGDMDLAAEFKQKQMEKSIEIQKSILKYFNLFAFVLLPIYTLIAFLVYRKPYNFGEHLIINAYIQGVTFLTSVLLFVLGLFLTPKIYYSNLLVMVVFYTYAYGKLYNLSFGKSLLKILKFIAVFIGVLLALSVMLFIIGVTVGLIKKMMG